MFFSTCSAGALSGPDFCFIFAPRGYDEPEILPSGSPSIGLTGADGGQSAIVGQSLNEPLSVANGPPMSRPFARQNRREQHCPLAILAVLVAEESDQIP